MARRGRRGVVLTYRTSSVARLAGAASLPVFLAVWGGFSLLVVGETTVTTWALGLATMFPVSALLLGASRNRAPPRSGAEYAVGLVVIVVTGAGRVTVSVAFVGVGVADSSLVGAVAGVGPVELVAAAVGSAALGGVLALVDVRYVERPETAAVLEARYLDDPVASD